MAGPSAGQRTMAAPAVAVMAGTFLADVLPPACASTAPCPCGVQGAPQPAASSRPSSSHPKPATSSPAGDSATSPPVSPQATSAPAAQSPPPAPSDKILGWRLAGTAAALFCG